MSTYTVTSSSPISLTVPPGQATTVANTGSGAASVAWRTPAGSQSGALQPGASLTATPSDGVLTISADVSSTVAVGAAVDPAPTNLARRYAYDEDGRPVYQGEAAAGTDPGDAAWRIVRTTYEGQLPVAVEPMAGGAYDQVWTTWAGLA